MSKLLFLLILSFNVFAEDGQGVELKNIREGIAKVQAEIRSVESKVQESLQRNEHVAVESKRLFENVERNFKVQDEFQIYFIEKLEDIKKFNEESADLQLSVATDKPYVFSVVLAILVSAFITWLLLRKDAKSGHSRLIKEFRQAWINEFRSNVSSYVDVLFKIQAFQKNNIDFIMTKNTLLKVREEYGCKVEEVNEGVFSTVDKVKKKMLLFRKYEELLRMGRAEEYQQRNNEYLELLSRSKILNSKLTLLFKPEFGDGDERDEAVFNVMTEISNYLENPDTKHSVLNYDVLVGYSQKMLQMTQELLKKEWDRIRDHKQE